MAATNWLAVHLYGRSGHAGKPHEGIDTAVAVSSMVMNFQSIISRNLNPLDPAVLTIGKVEAGTARNVIAGEAKIEGTARTFSRQAQEMIERRVKEIAKAHEQMYGVDVSVDFQQSSHGALINDPGVVEDVMEKAGEVFDPSEFTHVEAMMLGEDFANYLEEMDGCFAFIGGGDHPANHHGKFDFDEKALVNGVKVFTCAAVDLLMESALDPAFLERDRLRKSGIPVKIAETERLLLRETIPSDIPNLYEIWKQGGMVRGTVPVLNTLDEETEFMEAYIRHAYLFYDFGLWTVIEKQSGQIIGQAGLFVSELLDDAVELGYLIGQSYRGKGYAQECGRAILAYAEEVLDLEELHVLIERTNDTSLHVAQKLGFGPYGQDQIHGAETAEDTETSLVHWHKMLT